MPFDAIVMLLLIGATLVVFALEIWPIEVTALSLLVILWLSGFVTSEQAISGFSNPAVVTIGALFILSHSLVKTGILEFGSERLSTAFINRKWVAVSLFLVVSGLISGFLNNTAVVAVFIPLAVTLCRRLGVSLSHVLIPLSYVSILGGTLTLIGTSTNLLVSSLAEKAGQPRFQMFEFLPLGAIFLVVGLFYILLFARRWLPARVPADPVTAEIAPFVTEVKILPDSALLGKSIREARILDQYDVTILSIMRSGRYISEDIPNQIFKENDILVVQGTMEDVLRLRSQEKVAFLPDFKLTAEEVSAEGQSIVEAVIPPNSQLIGQTLKEADFRRRYGAFVMAVRRHGETLRSRIGGIPLQVADTLLLLVPKGHADKMPAAEGLILLSNVDLQLKTHRFWWLPMALLPMVVLLSALDLVDILTGAVVSVVVLLVLGVVRTSEAYRSIDWSVLILIAAFVPVSDAILKSGAADSAAAALYYLTEVIFSGARAQVAVSLVYLVTSLSTQLISNTAAAIILTPVCLSLASSLQVDPRPLLIAVCFAASAEFMTPFGYQTNMMVYGPGRYRFLDYTRFGFPLNIVFWLLATLLIPIFWNFSG